MYCIKCGTELLDGAEFCVKCGTKIGAENKCKKCGKELSPDMQFCPYCGTDKTKKEATGQGQAVISFELPKNVIKKDGVKEFVLKNKALITKVYIFVLSLIMIWLYLKPVLEIPRYDMSYIYGASTFGEIAKLAKLYEEWIIYAGALVGYVAIGLEILLIVLLFKMRNVDAPFVLVKKFEVLGLVFFWFVAYSELDGMTLCSNFWIICGLTVFAMIFKPSDVYKKFENYSYSEMTDK